MVVNVGLETLFGAVPVLGDLFDATYKANTRNFYLLERHVGQLGERPLERPSNRGVVVFLTLLLILIVVGVSFALWAGIWLFRQLLGAI